MSCSKSALKRVVLDYEGQLIKQAEIAHLFIRWASDPSWLMTDEFLAGVKIHAARAATMANLLSELRKGLR